MRSYCMENHENVTDLRTEVSARSAVHDKEDLEFYVSNHVPSFILPKLTAYRLNGRVNRIITRLGKL